MTVETQTGRIDLLRHGEPIGGRRFRGGVNDPLSEKGWLQMRLATEGERWALVVTSPLSRCAEFANALARDQGIPCHTLETLREFSFGQWEGRPVDEVLASDGAALRRFWADPLRHGAPGGESLTHFQARIEAAWVACVELAGRRPALVVAHGGVIRMMLARLLGMPSANMFRIEVPYACRTRIGLGEGTAGWLISHGASA